MDMQKENIRKLLMDVVIDIMTSLSVKSLVRFRCVSKFWHDFINNPTFINNHFMKRQNRGDVLLVRSYLSPPRHHDLLSFHKINSPELEEVLPNLSIPIVKDLELEFDPLGTVHVLGPCSGLVCLACHDWIFFCNPALREFKLLPRCPFICPEDYIFIIMGVGFGYSCKNDFKVVLIRNVDKEIHSINEFHVIAHLYSLSTNSWRQVDTNAIIKSFVVHDPCSEVYFNGVCHWNAFSTIMQDIEDSILCFNIRSEVFTLLPYPDCLKRPRTNISFLTVVNDCLVSLRFDLQMVESPRLIEGWMMKEYGVKESWIKSFVVGPCLVVRPLTPWRQDEWLLLETSNGQLESYALHSNKIERFQIYTSKYCMRALIYQESLVSLYPR